MPQTKVIFFKEIKGDVPVLDWLRKLMKADQKAWANCVARIKQLSASGHELRRPAADYLRDEIRELRAKHGHVQYRILYFFHGRNIAILAHAIIKEGGAVDDQEIEKAIKKRDAFKSNPKAHTHAE